MKEKMCSIKGIFCKALEADLNTPAVGYFWKGLSLFLLGVVVGFLIAPIKKGVCMGSHNGCNNGNNCSASGNALSLDKDEDGDNAQDE
jgi:hypothetical protein